MANQTFRVRDLRIKEKFFLDDAYVNGWAKYLKPFALAVYVSLCRHADKEQSAFPSQDTIAKEHGISRRTVIDKLQLLQQLNIIRFEKVRSKKGKWLNNTYYLLDKSLWKNPCANPAHGLSKCKKQQDRVQPLHTKDFPLKVSHHIGLKSQPKRKEITFKQELYDPILEEYQKLKGITLQGNEFLPIQQTIKTMFLAGRTPEQIIAVMRHISQKDWVDWTIRTVKIRLPDILPKLGLSQQPNREQTELEKKLAKAHEGGGQNEQ